MYRAIAAQLQSLSALVLTRPEIMVPLRFQEELIQVREEVEQTSSRLLTSTVLSLRLQLYPLIELPVQLSCLEEIAKHADSSPSVQRLSIQTCLCFSRDDVESALCLLYLERKIVTSSPICNS